jgi:hypothetical protein
MRSETDQSKVYRMRRVTMNVRIFEYGGGYRVQYVKTSNSIIDSELLAHCDEFHASRDAAISAFDQINGICKATFEAQS